MRFFYLFFLLLLTLPGRAQVPVLAWQQGYGTAARDERGGVAVAVPGPAGGFLIAGQQLLPNHPARAQVYLARTNQQGDTLWTRRFIPVLSLLPNPTGIAVDAQGNVLLAVSSISGTPAPVSHLIKFNPTCDSIIWQNLYQPTLQPGGSGTSGIINPSIAPDGNYLCLKMERTGGSGGFHTIANLVKLDASTGAEIWNFDISQYAVNAGYGPDVFALNSFATYSGGVMLNLDLYNPANQMGTEEYVFISDAGVLVQFQRRVITSSAPDNTPVFHTLRDGNIVVGRRQKLYKISTAAATAGDTLWYTVVPPASQYRDWDARDLVEDQDGNILLVGDSHFAPPNTTPNSRQIHLVRFTGRGVLDKDTILRRPGNNFARSAMLGDNGIDLIFSGYATSGVIGGEDMLLARYRGFRRLLATAPAANSSLTGLQLYPNPASGDAPVWAVLPNQGGGTLRVFDALGRLVAQQEVRVGQRQVAVPMTGRPSGMYLLRYQSAAGGPATTARLLRE